MAVVYKGRDTRLDRFVAFKVLPSHAIANPDRKRRFIRAESSEPASPGTGWV